MLLALVSLSSPAPASVLVTVNKTSQRMTVSVDGKPLYSWPVSTGMRGHATPAGSFRPFRMEVEHYSAEWDDAPMPHSIFFTGAGHAIHGSNATRHLGSPASHGCIRISPSNASKLFALVESEGMSNTKVVVTGGEPTRMAQRARPSRPQARLRSRPDYDQGYAEPDFEYVTGPTSSSVW
jgi:lipoprotein-anchoring transpeptidase ErfK/SrfK